MESTEIIEPHYHPEELSEITEHPQEEALDADIGIPETLEEIDAEDSSRNGSSKNPEDSENSQTPENSVSSEKEGQEILPQNPMDDITHHLRNLYQNLTPNTTKTASSETSEQSNTVSTPSTVGTEEMTALINPPSLGVGVKIHFELGTQQLSLEELRALQPRKIFALGGDDFQVFLKVQDRAIATAKLILVDGHPALQIDQIMTSSQP